MRTITIDYPEDAIHIVLGRSTVADSRIRKQIWDKTENDPRVGENSALPFFLTQIVLCEGLPFHRCTALPSDDHLDGLIEAWLDVPEVIANDIATAVIALRNKSDDQKKDLAPSGPSSKSTSEAVKTPNT